LVADLTKSLVPRPYTIYRRAKGILLADAPQPPQAYTSLYREVGEAIARIGSIPIPEDRRANLKDAGKLDAQEHLQKSFDAGAVSREDVPIIEKIITQLESLGAEPAPSQFVHRDIHPWNFFIDPATGALEVIIDWGDAAWGEPAIEFASMPLVALKPMLQGYGKADRNLLVRTLHISLSLALWEVRGLDPQIFKREWWRCAVGGWQEELRLQEELLEL
jgi:aminoglycoside phosphotransferase (APT) family kinase protein